MSQTWRDIVRPIIARVLARLPRRATRSLKERMLFGHYPFAERRGRCYRVWRDEVRIQLGLRPPRRRCLARLPDSPGQQTFF